MKVSIPVWKHNLSVVTRIYEKSWESKKWYSSIGAVHVTEDWWLFVSFHDFVKNLLNNTITDSNHFKWVWSVYMKEEESSTAAPQDEAPF